MSEVYYLNQNNTYQLSFQLVDEAGTGIPAYNIASLNMTYYYFNPQMTTSDKNHLKIINSRNNQNVKNANDVSVDSSGNVVWEIKPADTVKLNNQDLELHVAFFKWKWGSGKTNSQEIYLYVRKIPFSS